MAESKQFGYHDYDITVFINCQTTRKHININAVHVITCDDKWLHGVTYRTVQYFTHYRYGDKIMNLQASYHGHVVWKSTFGNTW